MPDSPACRILCVDCAPLGLRRLIRSFARPGRSVEGVLDFAQALALLTAEPARFELIVVGRAKAEGSALRFLRGLQRLHYPGHVFVASPGRGGARAAELRAPGVLTLLPEPASRRAGRMPAPRV